MADIKKQYFDWICFSLLGARDQDEVKLLYLLDSIPFTYSVPFDDNRFEDGVDLRYRFGYLHHIPSATIAVELDLRDCSVLEMMTALSLRCEEQIMVDPDKGNRIGKWFWRMVDNLGLKPYGHTVIDKQTVETIVRRFLDRRYKPNGEGGLFTIPGCSTDLRTVEIWTQLNWYLDYIIDEKGEN